MTDFVDATAFNFEQGQRSRKLFAAVVLAALDDAIADDKKYGNGPEQIARWARSKDGREVLSCAGIRFGSLCSEGRPFKLRTGERVMPANSNHSKTDPTISATAFAPLASGSRAT